MPLTAQQATTLKAAINANPTWAAFSLTDDGYIELARALDQPATPAFWVYSTNVDVQAVKDAIIWANLTPADVPDGTQAWANRSLQCQGKQFNIQLILPVAGTMDGSKVNTRSGLQDALTGIRSGVGGAAQGAGWAVVQQALTRRATAFERIFADTAGGNDGSTRPLAAAMVLQGAPSPVDIQQARNS